MIRDITSLVESSSSVVGFFFVFFLSRVGSPLACLFMQFINPSGWSSCWSRVRWIMRNMQAIAQARRELLAHSALPPLSRRIICFLNFFFFVLLHLALTAFHQPNFHSHQAAVYIQPPKKKTPPNTKPAQRQTADRQTKSFLGNTRQHLASSDISQRSCEAYNKTLGSNIGNCCLERTIYV